MARISLQRQAEKRALAEAAKELVAQTRADQGIPDTVSDVEVLRQIAALLKQGVA